MSLPGLFAVILYAGRAIVMSSGLPQYPWSGPPSPTFYFEPSFSSILAKVNDVLLKIQSQATALCPQPFLHKVTWERIAIIILACFSLRQWPNLKTPNFQKPPICWLAHGIWRAYIHILPEVHGIYEIWSAYINILPEHTVRLDRCDIWASTPEATGYSRTCSPADRCVHTRLCTPGGPRPGGLWS